MFPQGYPVARIAEIRHDSVQPLAQILATPLAHLSALHEIMLVWFQDSHPAAPTHLKDGAATIGNPALQRQPAPTLDLLPMPAVRRLAVAPPVQPPPAVQPQPPAQDAQ